MVNKKYATHAREPFFEIANKNIKVDSKVLDIGAGSGKFSSYCKRNDFYLFDGNQETVNFLKQENTNVFLGELPILPFENDFFDLIHCSHVVEHLTPDVFYQTLKEMDRCLKVGGFIVVSAPILWSGFYDDLSHVKPYSPGVFMNYLGGKNKNSRTRKIVSENYICDELTYRFLENKNPSTQFSNKNNKFFIKVILKGMEILKKMGLTSYERTGFTIVMRKTK